MQRGRGREGRGGGGKGGSEELLETRHADEEEQSHDDDGGGEGGHEERLAIELLGILDGALGFERELEVDRHREGYEGEAEDQLDAISNDEGAEEEHGGRGVEDDGDEQGFRGVALEGGAIGTGERVVTRFVQLGEFAEALEGHEVTA